MMKFLNVVVSLFFASIVCADLSDIGTPIDLRDLQGQWTVEEHRSRVPMTLPNSAASGDDGGGDFTDASIDDLVGEDPSESIVSASTTAGSPHLTSQPFMTSVAATTTAARSPAGVVAAPPTRPMGGVRPNMACDSNTDVTWDINGDVWKRRSSVPDKFNSNGRYYIEQAVKGEDMNFIVFRAFADLVDEMQPCIGYIREGNVVRVMMNASDPTSCPSKFDEYAGVCSRWEFWVGTCSGGECLAVGGGPGNGNGAGGRVGSGVATTSGTRRSSSSMQVLSSLQILSLAIIAVFSVRLVWNR